MGTKYSGNEIFEIGIQIEKKGYDFYKILESETKNENLKKLFHWLSNQEKRHIKIFQELRQHYLNYDFDKLYNWDEVSLYFKALIETKVFPDSEEGKNLIDELEDEIGAIQIAISFEKDNILYFQEIRDLVDNEDKKIINELINEEKNHIMKLLDIKKQVSDN